MSLLLLAALLLGLPSVLGSTCPLAPAYDSSGIAMLASLKGTCQTYSDVLPDGSMSFCKGMVDYPYYLPATYSASGVTQVDLERRAQQEFLGGNAQAALLLTLLPGACTTQLKRAVCSAVFQPCELVDAYFLDTSCGAAAVCTTCGSLTAEQPPRFYNASELAPSYGSKCIGASTNQAAPCVVAPGRVPGRGDLTWQQVGANAEKCAELYLVFDPVSGSCKVAIPRTPCRGTECHPLWSTSVAFNPATLATEAVCPLISGNFALHLQGALATVTDTAVKDQLIAANNTQGLLGRTSIPLLMAFNMLPQCDKKDVTAQLYQFAKEFTLESATLPYSAGGVIKAKAQYWNSTGGRCECTSATECTMQTCAELISRTALCHNSAIGSNGAPRSLPLPNPSIGFANLTADMPALCAKIATNPELNQPDPATLAGLQLKFGLASPDIALGAYFIPPAPGLPALAVGEQSRPLCRFPDLLNPAQVFTGNSSQSCLLAKVKSVEKLVPAFVQGECRTRFHDLLCNQAFMKLEPKSLCLLGPNACANNQFTGAATHTIPFSFALPRFPGNAMCKSMLSECSGFFSTLSTAQQAMVNAAFDCDGAEVGQSCEANGIENALLWECSSSLNGLKSYPSETQVLANLSTLLGGVALPGLAQLGSSAVVLESLVDHAEPGFTTCDCPAPLVVPQNPNAPTLAPGVCCAQVCEGSLYSAAHVDAWGMMNRIIPIFSIIGSGFILITWATFRVKRSQPFTFFFALSSLCCAFAFLIPGWSAMDPREVWCKDNTQANRQEDGGMCLFQSIWITYWVLTACCFWLVQSFDLYLRIVKNYKVGKLQPLHKYFHAFAWGYPLLVPILMLATNNAGYEAPNTWCFFAAPRPGEEVSRQVIELLFFYGSIIAICIVGMTFMGFVLREIFVITKRAAVHKQAANGNESGGGGGGGMDSKRLALFRTPIVFIFFFVFVWLTIISWKFDSVAHTGEMKAAAQVWVGCLLSNFAAGVLDPAHSPLANNTVMAQFGRGNGTGCGDSYPRGPSVGSYAFLLLIIGLQGVFVFILFGLRVENFNLWREKLGLTSKKYDTTGRENESSTKPNHQQANKGTLLSSLGLGSSKLVKNAGSGNAGGGIGEQEGGSAVMMNSIQSGKFLSVNEDLTFSKPGKSATTTHEVAAYMSEPLDGDASSSKRVEPE